MIHRSILMENTSSFYRTIICEKLQLFIDEKKVYRYSGHRTPSNSIFQNFKFVTVIIVYVNMTQFE